MAHITFKFLKKISFFEVSFSSFVVKILSFFIVVLLSRILTTTEIGLISYVESMIRMIAPLLGGGVFYGMLIYGAKFKKLVPSILRQSLSLSFYINSLIIFFVAIFMFFYTFAFNDSKVLFVILLIAAIIKNYQEIFYSFIRSLKKNNIYAKFLIAQAFLSLTLIVSLSYYHDVYGYGIGVMLSSLIILLTIYSYLKGLGKGFLSRKQKKYINKLLLTKSIGASITGFFSSLLYSIDIFLISILLLSETLTSQYYIATLIPLNISFVTLAAMTAFFPYISENFNNKTFLANTYFKFLKYSFVFALFVVILLVNISDFVIPFLFGESYLGSITSFNYLLIGATFGASFRIVSGNYLAALGYVKENMYIAIFSIMLNVVLNYYLILKYGIEGAAISTAIVLAVSGFLGFFLIITKIKTHKLQRLVE
jgi:O-antigen/teichoic acid export membrane protein